MDYVQLYRDAWNATKKPTQPEYDNLIEEYRNLLAQRAAGAMNGQISDGPFGAFEAQVYEATRPQTQQPERVIDEPDPEPVPIAEPEPAQPEPEPEPKKAAPKKTAKKPAATKTAKKPVKVIKAAKKGKK